HAVYHADYGCSGGWFAPTTQYLTENEPWGKSCADLGRCRRLQWLLSCLPSRKHRALRWCFEEKSSGWNKPALHRPAIHRRMGCCRHRHDWPEWSGGLAIAGIPPDESIRSFFSVNPYKEF